MDGNHLFKLIRQRCRSDGDVRIVELKEMLQQDSIIEVGSSSLNAGLVLSPVLFNLYLEDALNSSQMLGLGLAKSAQHKLLLYSGYSP